MNTDFRVSMEPMTGPAAGCTAELGRLGDEIAELSAHLDAATARLLDLIRDFDAQGGWGNGFRSCAEWLSWRVGLDRGTARERVRVARALGALPPAGRGACPRRAVVREGARADPCRDPRTTEERLLAVGRAGTAEHVERIVRGWRRVDKKAEAMESAKRHMGRALHLYQDEDGMVVIRARLEPEVGAVVRQALDAAREALYQRARGSDAGAGMINKNVPAERLRPTFPRSRRPWLSSRPTRWACSRRARSTTESSPARRASATRSSSTSMPPCSRILMRRASQSSTTAYTFPRRRPDAWPATRRGW